MLTVRGNLVLTEKAMTKQGMFDVICVLIIVLWALSDLITNHSADHVCRYSFRHQVLIRKVF